MPKPHKVIVIHPFTAKDGHASERTTQRVLDFISNEFQAEGIRALLEIAHVDEAGIIRLEP